MTTIKKTFSLEGEIPQLEQRNEELAEEIAEIERRAQDMKDNGRNKGDAFKRLKKEWKEMKVEVSVNENKIERFGQYVNEWESTEFRVRELTFGETQKIKDTVANASFDVDIELQEIEGTPLQGLYESEFLKKAVVEMPDDAPDDPNDLPEVLGDWLVDKCEAINSVGDTSVGNMSLEDELN